MTTLRRGILAAGLLALSACGSPMAPTLTTGLTGVVVRGPVTPVCQVDVPCDAPFSASFTVFQNTTTVTRFRSDSAGRFSVRLAPGTYRIVPDADAPVIAPASQAKVVDVAAAGLTDVLLSFDTGIR